MRKSKNSKNIRSWWNTISEVDSPMKFSCLKVWGDVVLLLFGFIPGAELIIMKLRRGIQVLMLSWCCFCSPRLRTNSLLSPLTSIYLFFLSLSMWNSEPELWTILHHFPSPSGSSGSEVTLLTLRMYRVVMIRIILLNVKTVFCRI